MKKLTSFIMHGLVYLGLAISLIYIPVSTGWAQSGEVCGTWEVVSSPDPGDRTNRLVGVTALAADEAWTVGTTQHFGSPARPLIIRWDGTAWQEVALASEFSSITLTSVGSAAGGNVWAIGHRTVSIQRTEPQILHWQDGTLESIESITLRPQTVYPFAVRSGYPQAIDGTAPDDMWIVGEASGFGDGQANTVGLALHWDGSTWTEVDVPLVADRRHHLSSVSVLSPGDAWAVGYYRKDRNPHHALIYHWDGQAWEYVPSPAEDIAETFLFGVTAIAPDDVWAVGQQPGGALFMHWDGQTWRIEPSPVAVTTRIRQVAVIASDDIWATPTLGTTSFFHYDGTAWAEAVDPPVPGAVSFGRNGGLAVVGPCDVWSVGSYDDGTQSHTLVERLQAGGTTQPPVAVASATPSEGTAPVTVTFSSAGSYDPDGTITSHAWSFGDGGTSTEANPTHIYSAPGTYTATLHVTDDQGAIGSSTTTVTVTEPVTTVLHVASQVVVEVIVGKRRKSYAEDHVYIQDARGAPAAGVAVEATYTGLVSGSAAGVTDANGSVVLSTRTTRSGGESWCFTIRNVSKAGYTYDPAANTVTTQCEDGTMSTARASQFEVSAFPNPFNPETTIQFTLDQEDVADLRVYDALGREVSVLVRQVVHAPGAYRYHWDGRNSAGMPLPTGLYFLRVRTGTQHEVYTLLLMK